MILKSQKYILFLFHLFSILFISILSCKADKTTISPIIHEYTSHDYYWTVDTLHAFGALQIMMSDIWGTDENNVFVVGHSDVTKYQIWHWNGKVWTNIDPRISGDSPSYYEIIGFSDKDIWIVGDGAYRIGNNQEIKHREYILHFDGTQWRRIKEIKAPSCYSIWGISSNELYFGCDSGIVLNFSGKNWKKQYTGNDAQISSIWGFNSDYIYATGYSWLTKTYYFFKKNSGQWEIKDSGQ